MPEVGLSARPPTSVGPATVVINTNARWIKNLVGVTIPDGVLVSSVPSSTRQSPSAYAAAVSVAASDPTNVWILRVPNECSKPVPVIPVPKVTLS